MTAALAAVGGAALATVLLRRRRTPVERLAPGAEAHPTPPQPEAPAADPRADELRRKLAEAREGAADEQDFEAAGMGAETIVDEEVDDLRRRVHEEARAAADEMRRAGGPEEA
jgi:hypothetical protein